MAEEEMKVVRVVEWNYVEAPVYKGTALPHDMVRTNPKVVDAECSCGAKFRARQAWVELREGTFYVFPLSIAITCPGCKNTFGVGSNELPNEG